MCTFETVGKVLLVGLCGLTHYTRYLSLGQIWLRALHGLQSFICRLEELATYAVITVIVDFLIFMSFYPAGLSLVIELMFNKVTTTK